MSNTKTTMSALAVTIQGVETEDLIDALAVIIDHVAQGYTLGFNSNATGSYTFEVKPSREAECNPNLLAPCIALVENGQV